MSLGKYLVEFIGTFIFLGVILNVVNQKVKWAAFALGLALTTAIFFGGGISGGHFNPAVSFMMYLNKAIDIKQLMVYILAQVLGGVAVLCFTKTKSLNF